MQKRYPRLQPAAGVLEAIDKRKGVSIAAKITGADRVAVWRWTQPRSRRGTGGFIPPEHMGPLLAWARENGKHLTAEMFVRLPEREQRASAAHQVASVE